MLLLAVVFITGIESLGLNSQKSASPSVMGVTVLASTRSINGYHILGTEKNDMFHCSGVSLQRLRSDIF